jgi:POT family proton-dependent oligopeptide transporter
MDEPLEKVEAKLESGVTAPAPEGSMAPDDEICNLRHVSAPLPMRVWLAATIGMAERFSYYEAQTLFR